MAVNNASYITNAGIEVIKKLMASKGPLVFKRGQLGSGTVTSADAARARTSLVTPVVNAPLVGVAYAGGAATVEIQYSNENLTQGFFVREIGLWCQDPDNSANEILYCYAAVGDNGDWMAPKTSAVYFRTYKIESVVDSATSVTVTATPGLMVSKEEFNAESTLVRQIIDADVGAVYQYARAKFSEIDFTTEVKTVNLTNTLAYPFNGSQQTVPLAISRRNADYEVYYEIVGGGKNVGDVTVTDKLLNGFKLAYTGSAPTAQIIVHVKGGMVA